MSLWIPTILTLIVTAIFLIAERIFPGRELPNTKGWYARVLFVNALQIGITFATNKAWFHWLSGYSFTLSFKLCFIKTKSFIFFWCKRFLLFEWT